MRSSSDVDFSFPSVWKWGQQTPRGRVVTNKPLVHVTNYYQGCYSCLLCYYNPNLLATQIESLHIFQCKAVKNKW